MRPCSRCLLMAGCVLVLVGWADSSPHRNQIQLVSGSQRERLTRNLDEFLKLDRDQRRELSELHDALGNAGEERDALNQTLIRYALWLDTLTPSQRAEIDRADSTSERLKTVKRLIDQQNQQLVKDFRRLTEHGPLRSDRPPSPEREARRQESRQRTLSLIDLLEKELTGKLLSREQEVISDLHSKPNPERTLPTYLLALADKYGFDWQGAWAAERDNHLLTTANKNTYYFYFGFNDLVEWYPSSRRFLRMDHQWLSIVDDRTRSHFFKSVRMAYELPPVDENHLFLFFGENGNEREREAIRNAVQSRYRNRYTTGLAMKFQYYVRMLVENPDGLRSTVREPLNALKLDQRDLPTSPDLQGNSSRGSNSNNAGRSGGPRRGEIPRPRQQD